MSSWPSLADLLRSKVRVAVFAIVSDGEAHAGSLEDALGKLRRMLRAAATARVHVSSVCVEAPSSGAAEFFERSRRRRPEDGGGEGDEEWWEVRVRGGGGEDLPPAARLCAWLVEKEDDARRGCTPPAEVPTGGGGENVAFCWSLDRGDESPAACCFGTPLRVAVTTSMLCGSRNACGLVVPSPSGETDQKNAEGDPADPDAAAAVFALRLDALDDRGGLRAASTADSLAGIGVACRERFDESSGVGVVPAGALGHSVDLRILAIYFPQFHSVPVNNMLWGDGFTEWTLLGPHPGLPGRPLQKPCESSGLGVYDLTSPVTRARQGELAREAGLGFLVYHYWFGDEPIMHEPMRLMLKDGQPDTPFAFQWANEAWTRSWDGHNNTEVLLDQDYGDERTWKKHWDHLLPFFRHPNYIRVGGRPLFAIYRLGDIPHDKLEGMLAVWDGEAAKEGFPTGGVFLLSNLGAFADSNAASERFPRVDAFMVFEPMHENSDGLLRHRKSIIGRDGKIDPDLFFDCNPDLRNAQHTPDQIVSWLDPAARTARTTRVPFRHEDAVEGIPHSVVVEHADIHEECLDKACSWPARTAAPGHDRPTWFTSFDTWNNLPRRKGDVPERRPFMFVPFRKPATPFADIVRADVAATVARSLREKKPRAASSCFLFFNAWNEWNEQAILEPDSTNGADRLGAFAAMRLELARPC